MQAFRSPTKKSRAAQLASKKDTGDEDAVVLLAVNERMLSPVKEDTKKIRDLYPRRSPRKVGGKSGGGKSLSATLESRRKSRKLDDGSSPSPVKSPARVVRRNCLMGNTTEETKENPKTTKTTTTKLTTTTTTTGKMGTKGKASEDSKEEEKETRTQTRQTTRSTRSLW